MAQAGATLGPSAKQAAAKGLAGSGRSLGWLARVLTGGGKAAYSEFIGPMPVAGGQVQSVSAPIALSVPFEPAALLFVLGCAGAACVFLLPPLAQAIIAIAAPLVLLVFSWFGMRRPFFTKMSVTGLVGRLRNRGRAPLTSIQRFQVADATSGSLQDVVAVGPWQGAPIVSGATVEIWGIVNAGRNELRAWRLESVDASGQRLGVATTPRLIPLVVALLLPSFLLVIVWLVTIIV